MSSVGGDLIAAMKEAAAHANGKAAVAYVHTIQVPDGNAVRETPSLSRQACEVPMAPSPNPLT